MVKNLKLLDKALQLLPEVKETVVEPLDIAAFLKPLKKGDSVEIDFGRHLVGHIKLKLGYVRSHPDAPVWLRFSFAENKRNSRNGWKIIRAGSVRHGCSRNRCILILSRENIFCPEDIRFVT